jgi:hypothetical protein
MNNIFNIFGWFQLKVNLPLYFEIIPNELVTLISLYVPDLYLHTMYEIIPHVLNTRLFWIQKFDLEFSDINWRNLINLDVTLGSKPDEIFKNVKNFYISKVMGLYKLTLATSNYLKIPTVDTSNLLSILTLNHNINIPSNMKYAIQGIIKLLLEHQRFTATLKIIYSNHTFELRIYDKKYEIRVATFDYNYKDILELLVFSRHFDDIFIGSI